MITSRSGIKREGSPVFREIWTWSTSTSILTTRSDFRYRLLLPWTHGQLTSNNPALSKYGCRPRGLWSI
ncbi:unnamed protein product [Nesidiocoris tenuis]|uniref:Uncharacterized protein n=1 Tax=Nesidiocoris tenuis TaxID=355587 RepID=A0A6H5FUJ1_9HEMI|nr:unnamed protein product [Nesidiocoris tenuis]